MFINWRNSFFMEISAVFCWVYEDNRKWIPSIDQTICWMNLNYEIYCYSSLIFITATSVRVVQHYIYAYFNEKKMVKDKNIEEGLERHQCEYCHLIGKVNEKSLEFSFSIIIIRTRAAINVNVAPKRIDLFERTRESVCVLLCTK